MALKKQPQDLVLGRRWPHRLLQFLPAAWRHRYLLRQSGGTAVGEGFDLASRIQKARRFLIAWPARAEDILLAFPAMRILRAATGGDSTYAHLVPGELKSSIADLFPGEQILGWSPEELAWHDPDTQAVMVSLRAFSPEMTLNLLDFSPPVVKALMKFSGAGLRMAVGEENAWPYVNIQLQADVESPRAARYFQVLNPWRYAGFNLPERWPRLQAEVEQSRNVAEAWADSGAVPDRTWLYLHDPANAARTMDDEFHAWLEERIPGRDSEKVSFAIAILNPSIDPVARSGKWLDVPILKASSLSEFTGLAGIARGVASFPGPGLYAASLTDVPCLAFLRREEAAYDISRWNPLFKVEWV